jgi:ubiquinol-cytochrome c reductase cytochrome c1 subunit
MRRWLLVGLLAAALPFGGSARGQNTSSESSAQNWSFNGIFGTFDRASAQRGYQVYAEVCASCHSMKQMYYRNLEGIGLSPEEIKATASTFQVPGALNESGEPTERPALASDHFRAPFPNELAARAANGGALPPDQSVLELAREGGPDYLYEVLTGYGEPPAGMKVGTGLYYNKAFPGHQIAMPQPLHDEQVTYADGTKSTISQEAHDVVTFLAFAANPELEERHRTGVKVVLFLAVLTGLTYGVKRKIWADVH